MVPYNIMNVILVTFYYWRFLTPSKSTIIYNNMKHACECLFSLVIYCKSSIVLYVECRQMSNLNFFSIMNLDEEDAENIMLVKIFQLRQDSVVQLIFFFLKWRNSKFYYLAFIFPFQCIFMHYRLGIDDTSQSSLSLYWKKS